MFSTRSVRSPKSRAVCAVLKAQQKQGPQRSVVIDFGVGE